MIRLAPKYDRWLIALLGVVFFMPFLGGVHLFDWDEINFAECAREMLVTGDYLRIYIDYQPFWEKPPLFFWMQVLAMKIFGVGAYAARFPNAVCGVFSLLILFEIGKKLYNRTFAYFWVLAYIGSILPHLYFKSGIIDPWFNLFIFLGLYFLIRFYWAKDQISGIEHHFSKYTYLVIAAICTALGILTKGPVAFLITGLCLAVYWVYQRFRFYINAPQFLLYCVLVAAVTSLWFGIETAKNGTWFVETFFKYQIRLLETKDAGHGGFFGYHFVVVFFACFPASIFALAALWKAKKADETTFAQADFRHWMLILFWAVLILFSLVQSKIVHYSSLAYFPLTYLAATTLYDFYTKKSIAKWLLNTFLIIGILLSIILFLVPVLGQNIDYLRPLLAKDPFALGNLEAVVNWSSIDFLAAAFLLMVILLSFYFFKKSKAGNQAYIKGVWTLFIGMAMMVNLTLILFINKIEAYSQNAVISFYKNKEKEDCYIFPEYRTYAHLFYSKKAKVDNPNSYNRQWLLEGDIDKTVYFVAKIHRAEGLKKHPAVKELYRKNGFIFFERTHVLN